MRNYLKFILLGTPVLIIAAILIWVWFAVFSGISGYGSKNLCSAIYLQGREMQEVIDRDLSDFPKSMGTYIFNKTDSSITGSVWGLAKRKAIYRKECGCTVINDISEEEVRQQTFNIPLSPKVYPDTIPWPYGDKLITQVPDNLDMDKLKRVIDRAMAGKTSDGTPGDTRAFLVLYDGMIVGERYAEGFDQNTVMLGWSMSKSVTAAMIGILVKEGRLSIDQPAPIPGWKGTEKENITIRQLLQQTSGIDFVENYERPSNVITMLFSKGDMADYAAGLPLEADPGTRFNYNSGNLNILSKIIREQVGEEAYSAFPYSELFHKINAYSFILEPDASGTYIGSSYSYATARDFARFGLLYYNQGVWNGERILPEDWVEQSIQPSKADERKHYGFQIWMNGFDEKGNQWFPDVPADMYFADGYGGQYIFIIPSRKIIVVRLGLRKTDRNQYLKEVLEAFQSS